MRRLPAVSVAVLLCCLAMSANGAGEKELSGDTEDTPEMRALKGIEVDPKNWTTGEARQARGGGERDVPCFR